MYVKYCTIGEADKKSSLPAAILYSRPCNSGILHSPFCQECSVPEAAGLLHEYSLYLISWQRRCVKKCEITGLSAVTAT